MSRKSKSKSKSSAVTSFVLALVLVGPGLASAEERGSFDRTLSVTGDVSLDVHTGSGSISVVTGPAGSVTIHGEIRAGSWLSSSAGAADRVRRIEENPPIEQSGNVIRIGTDRHDDLYDKVSISYEITVPEATSIDAATGSGSTTIGDVQGPVSARTGSGSIRIGAVGSEVEARSGSGSIEIQRAGGRLDAKTGSGSITAEGVSGPITARSGSGSIELVQTGEGDVDVQSGSGSIRISGVRGGLRAQASSGSIRVEGELMGDWRLDGNSGRIVVDLPDDAGFELDARARSGGIELDHPVTVSGRISKNELRGTVRGGGHLLQIDSGSGSVRIR